MSAVVMRALASGTAVALYLRFGLEPTGWAFYWLSQTLDLAWLHWGYSAFRGAGYFFGLWALQLWACIGIGLAVAALAGWRGARNRRMPS